MAVNVSNIEVSEFSGALLDSCTLKKETSTDSFSYGDLLDYGSYDGSIAVMTSADKSAFIGVSLVTVDGAIDVDSKINISTKCVIRAPLKASGTKIYFGEMGAWATGSNGNYWSFENTSTEAVAHCLSESIVADAYGLWIVDPYTVRAITLFGFFELPA